MLATAFQNWLAALEKRHFEDLTFSEASRALRALSSTYVERRGTLAKGAALSGAGKRAAFALFYGPLHFLLVEQLIKVLPEAVRAPSMLVDLGCGTGAGGAAWAASAPSIRQALAIDRSTWALAEAVRTYRMFGLPARTRQADITTIALPKHRAAFLAAFALNELPEPSRETLLDRLVSRARLGDQLLVVEPLAGFVAPWWGRWRDTFVSAGGRADEWRFRVDLPAVVAKFDRAAGLNHRELTGRTLWLAGG